VCVWHPPQQVSVAGGLFQGHQAPRAVPSDCKGGGRPGGGTVASASRQAYGYLGCAYGQAYGNLGCAYESQGDFSKAIEYHTQHLAIAKEVGDRAGEGTAYGNLGTCHKHLT
jgi:hypothetical protein